MPFDGTQIAGAVVVLFGAAFLYLQIRHRPQATKEVQTGADLQARISGSPYTLVQLFAPLWTACYLAEPIVNGFKEETAGTVDVVHLSLLSEAGREVGGRYGVKVVPTSLLFNEQGDLVKRVNGVPNKDELISQIQ